VFLLILERRQNDGVHVIVKFSWFLVRSPQRICSGLTRNLCIVSIACLGVCFSRTCSGASLALPPALLPHLL
jgi:hypothetical protein